MRKTIDRETLERTIARAVKKRVNSDRQASERRAMTSKKLSHIDMTVKKLDDQLKDKLQGYAMRLRVAGKIYPEMDEPAVEIVLLDPVTQKIAYRKTSDPLRGESESEWNVGDAAEAVETAFLWREELEKTTDLWDQMNEPFDDNKPFDELFET